MVDFNAATNGDKKEVIEMVNLDPEKFKAKFDIYKVETKKLQAKAEKHIVDSDESAGVAVGMVTQSKGFVKKLDALHKKITDPFQKFKSGIDGFRKSHKDDFLKIEKILTPKIAEFNRKKRAEAEKKAEDQRKAQAEIQKKLDAEAKKEKREPVKAAPVVVQEPEKIKTDSGTATGKLEWTHELEDITKVPAEYLLLDEKKIKHLVKAGIREIPGIKIFQQEKINYRSK